MTNLNRMEYFSYLSEHTINMLYEQIPSDVIQNISLELGINVMFITAKVTKGQNGQKLLTERLKLVLAYLEKHESNNIGTVENPKKYFRGTLHMFSHFIPQGFGAKRRELIYYSGSTQNTIIGLGGAAVYAFSNIDKESTMGEVSSALPYLTHVLAKESKIKTMFSDEEMWSDDILALDAIEYIEKYNKKGRQIHNMKFFAKLKLDSKNIEGYDTKRRIILGSPLYVAFAD